KRPILPFVDFVSLGNFLLLRIVPNNVVCFAIILSAVMRSCKINGSTISKPINSSNSIDNGRKTIYNVFTSDTNRNLMQNLAGLLVMYCVNLHLTFVENNCSSIDRFISGL
ncbi:hypothetical protein V1477_010182, partial [Vespula maculifrons]